MVLTWRRRAAPVRKEIELLQPSHLHLKSGRLWPGESFANVVGRNGMPFISLSCSGFSILPGIHPNVARPGDGIFQLGPIDRTPIRCQLSPKVRIIIRTLIIKRRNISIAPTSLTVSRGIVSVEAVASREGTVAPGNPSNMGHFLGMALHMPLQVLLSLEAQRPVRVVNTKSITPSLLASFCGRLLI
jgi:hypothetical protein